MAKIVIVFILFGFWTFGKSDDAKKELAKKDPEIFMNATEIIKSYGYPVESHTVLTEDGYFLTLHRIPFGKSNKSVENRPVVFLQHGLLDSSFTWLCNLPEKSLGFILADYGFDVWMGNSRGNVYSRGHVKYSANSNDYWDFSWDEMAHYDLPASIEHVLRITKAKKISYIGHSQGTAIAFAKFSQYSDLNERISSIVAYAPVAYLGNIRSGIRYLAYVSGGIDFFYSLFRHGEFLPTTIFTKLLANYVCGLKSASLICSNMIFLLSGPDTSNMNYTRLPVYLSHNPAGTSSRNMVHFAQCYKSNEFKRYDYGLIGNLYHYHRTSPPTYNLNTNGIPLAMFWGGNDYLAVPQDVSRAIHEFNHDVEYRKFIPSYNHMDFIWGQSAPELVYKDTIEFILKNSPQD